MALPPAGWYLHPDSSDTLRWWSGEHWTDHRQPLAGTPPVQTFSAADNVFAWLGAAFAAISLFVNPIAAVSVVAITFALIGLARARSLAGSSAPHTGRVAAVAGLSVALFTLLLAGAWFVTGRPLVG